MSRKLLGVTPELEAWESTIFCLPTTLIEWTEKKKKKCLGTLIGLPGLFQHIPGPWPISAPAILPLQARDRAEGLLIHYFSSFSQAARGNQRMSLHQGQSYMRLCLQDQEQQFCLIHSNEHRTFLKMRKKRNMFQMNEQDKTPRKKKP